VGVDIGRYVRGKMGGQERGTPSHLGLNSFSNKSQLTIPRKDKSKKSLLKKAREAR